jgi:hypothetical protein
MDSTLHSIVAAAYIQDRMAEAASAGIVRDAKRSRRDQPGLSAVRRRFGRRAPAATATPVQPVGVTPLPPR